MIGYTVFAHFLLRYICCKNDIFDSTKTLTQSKLVLKLVIIYILLQKQSYKHMFDEIIGNLGKYTIYLKPNDILMAS